MVKAQLPWSGGCPEEGQASHGQPATVQGLTPPRGGGQQEELCHEQGRGQKLLFFRAWKALYALIGNFKKLYFNSCFCKFLYHLNPSLKW